MSFKNYPVSALTLSARGHVDIIKMSQQAGYTTACWQNYCTKKRRESERKREGGLCVCVFTHMHANTSKDKKTHTSQTYEVKMTYHFSSIPSLGYIETAHNHIHTLTCIQFTSRHILTHTLTLLPQDTDCPPLSVYELICLRQTGWRWGHL